jgi:Zn-dependent protease
MDILSTILSLAILIYSSILHEIAHGYVAYRLGDPTAKIRGRITLNPSSHIDPVMSVIIPLMTYIGSAGTFIFGGAKPVPVDPFNFRDHMKDLALVSLAGPGTNILLAILGSIVAHALFPDMSITAIAGSGIFGFIIKTIIEWNLLLAILNLMPIPPLDGSKIFALILPQRTAEAYLAIGNSSLGMFLLIAVFFFTPLSSLIGALITFTLGILGF